MEIQRDDRLGNLGSQVWVPSRPCTILRSEQIGMLADRDFRRSTLAVTDRLTAGWSMVSRTK